MDFTPEADDEVIREVVLQIFDRPLVNTPNKVCRDSTQTKSPISPFQIGDSLIYTNEGYNDMMELLVVNKNDPDSIMYIIKFLRVNIMLVTKGFLISGNVT